MIKNPLYTCSENFCDDCIVHSKLNCHISIGQLFTFYAIVFPSLIIGGIGIYQYSLIGLAIWFVILGSFFLIIEIRILCTHCPHYQGTSDFLNCWANYGVPKLWRYRPGPMNTYEKTLLISGFVAVWGYPMVFIFIMGEWILLAGYISFVLLFFIVLRQFYCKKCINFSCPLNRVNSNIREAFLKNNPSIKKLWENAK